MPNRLPQPSWLAVVVFWCASTGAARADPIVTGSAAAQPDGSYLYQYTLSNPPLSNGDNVALYVFSPNGSATGFSNITTSAGWLTTSFGWVIPPLAVFDRGGNFYWDNSTFGQLTGETSTFSFTSKQTPTTVTYRVSGYGYVPTAPGVYEELPGGYLYEGSVVGPTSVLVAPEPGSAILLASAGGLLLIHHLRRWRAVVREGA